MKLTKEKTEETEGKMRDFRKRNKYSSNNEERNKLSVFNFMHILST